MYMHCGPVKMTPFLVIGITFPAATQLSKFFCICTLQESFNRLQFCSFF